MLDLFGCVWRFRASEKFGNQGNGIDEAADLGAVAVGDAANAADGDMRPQCIPERLKLIKVNPKCSRFGWRIEAGTKSDIAGTIGQGGSSQI